MIYRCGPALEIPSDPPQFRNKLGRLRNSVIRFSVLVKSPDQFRVLQIIAAVFPEITIMGGIFLEIVVKVSVLVHVTSSFLITAT
jgi:hypothetical protein